MKILLLIFTTLLICSASELNDTINCINNYVAATFKDKMVLHATFRILDYLQSSKKLFQTQ